MKKILIILPCLIMSWGGFAQNYIDLLKLSYGSVTNVGFDQSNESTAIDHFAASLAVPIPVSDKVAIITGMDYEHVSLTLSPETNSTTIHNLVLKAGLNIQHTDVLSGTYILLPKRASDLKNATSDDYQFGGVFYFKYQKKENLSYKFGLYGTTEAFGFFLSPVIGFYYTSPNKKWEVNVSMPVLADANYQVNDNLKVGADFKAAIRGYNLTSATFQNAYVHRINQHFALYGQLGLMDNKIQVQGRIGYGFNNYAVFENGDLVDLGLPLSNVGDDRRQLSPDLSASPFFELNVIYRYQL